MSSTPLLLRFVYAVIPMRIINQIVPPGASLGRQVAGVGAVSFAVGASMELFMIKTGFYEVATRKEAERRALVLWEREEQARIRRERRMAAAAPDVAKPSKEKLLSALLDLRVRERETGQKFDAEKKKIKAQLREMR